MKIYKRKKTNFIEIKTMEDMKNYIKNPLWKFGNRDKINDFIDFSPEDKTMMESIVLTDKLINRHEFEVSYVSKIFKHKSKTQLNYWLCRGWNEQDAISKISDIQKRYGISCKRTMRENGNYKKSSTTNIEYYLNKGMSADGARKALAERQSTFTLDKCIKRHGLEEGTKRFNERQSKWLTSLYNKSDDEIKRICSDRVNNKLGKASKTSLNVFIPLIEKLKSNELISDGDYFIGYENLKEFFLYDKEIKRLSFYDFVIPKYNTIIEYNGRIWHPHGDNWLPQVFINSTAEECISRDEYKKSLAEKNGFEILYIWDDENINDCIEKCFLFIQEHVKSISENP